MKIGRRLEMKIGRRLAMKIGLRKQLEKMMECLS